MVQQAKSWIDYGTSGTMPPIEVVSLVDYQDAMKRIRLLEDLLRDAMPLLSEHADLSERTRELLSLKSNAPRHDASAASLPNAEGQIGQPFSAEDRATVEQYLADVTCPVCHCPKHMHRPGCSAKSDKGTS